jgi:hypothetical protein
MVTPKKGISSGGTLPLGGLKGPQLRTWRDGTADDAVTPLRANSYNNTGNM